DFPSAIKYNMSALDLLGKLEGKESDFLLETTLNNLGLAYQNSGDFKKSILYFDRALGTSKKMEKNYPLLAALRENRAYSKLKMGIFETVEVEMQEALKMRRQVKDIPGTITNL